MLVFAVFVILLTLTVANNKRLTIFLSKSREDWILDTIGLCFQGIIIPVFQITVVYQLYQFLIPNFQGELKLNFLASFIISFVFVDYLYYWNHRLFHTKWLWSIHQVHHTVTSLDILGTSRNTLWTSFFIVYLWIHSLFIYLLQDPSWYILGVSLTSALDLWRHSKISPQPQSFLYQLLSPWLILPLDHAWHHASDHIPGNYGANCKIWDRLHRTHHTPEQAPSSLGIQSHLSLTKKLFFPF
ncbi:MAG: sterol desaturase family protein [Chlorogloeopsis fritschii C42_A2020_084]|uniref:sterol desaturase family protein n=1 Tax=Chlorogloeopsis fritschii TaxID=1124 RepID=UPI0019F354D5|nr:sterol desaturase family protein [Chlorogloeopsis fritschii]MBF2008395.1 sterol desaturase family protein [Chlorogloeopsis fritschii C42_A2020_084]